MAQKPHPNNFRSRLARVRGLGAAHGGVSHWWAQRLTALALAPLCIWFLACVMAVARSGDPFRVADWLGSPLAAVTMLLFLGLLFWHAKLGLQVVIEDYVHSPGAKYFLLIANTFFCTAAGAASMIAVLRLHMFDLVAAGGV